MGFILYTRQSKKELVGEKFIYDTTEQNTRDEFNQGDKNIAERKERPK